MALNPWARLLVLLVLGKREYLPVGRVEDIEKWLHVAWTFRLEETFDSITAFCIMNGARSSTHDMLCIQDDGKIIELIHTPKKVQGKFPVPRHFILAPNLYLVQTRYLSDTEPTEVNLHKCCGKSRIATPRKALSVSTTTISAI